MLDIIDLPRYLSEHQNKVEDVKVVCVLNRQVNMPQHLKGLDRNSGNIPSLVDLVGIDISGRKYLVKGQAVALLGPLNYEETSFGKRVLLLNGTAILRDAFTNYVEILLIYPRKDGSQSLYATRVLHKEVAPIRNAYHQFM